MKRVIVSILAGIGVLSLVGVLLVVVLGRLMSTPEEDAFNIESEVNSPDGLFRATHFIGMGGGAVGWCREVVTIKPVSLLLEEPRNWERDFNVFDVSCNSNVRMRWTGNSEFVITFSVKGRDGGASSYFKPVDRTGKVHVSFNVEA